MNLPNKITTFRLIMIPVLLATALIEFPFHWVVTVLIYFIACVSDLIDGNIARNQNIVTDFGKLMDPLSDKALVLTAFVIMVKLGYCDVVCFSLMLSREFLVSGIRMIACTKGKVIAANIFGKCKTFMQMASTGLVFFALGVSEFFAHANIPFNFNILSIAAAVMFWIACVVSVLSGIKYAKDGWYLIESK